MDDTTRSLRPGSEGEGGNDGFIKDESDDEYQSPLFENIHQVLAAILTSDKLRDIETDTFRQIERDLQTLMATGAYHSLYYLSTILLQSQFSVDGFIYLLDQAATAAAASDPDTAEQVRLQYEESQEAEQEQEAEEGEKEDQGQDSDEKSAELTPENMSRISEVCQLMPQFPKTMGLYDAWLRQLTGLLDLSGDEWTSSAAKARAVISCVRQLTTELDPNRINRLKFFEHVVKSHRTKLDEQFFIDLNNKLAPNNHLGYKWSTLRVYGGWPGFELLEARMKLIANVSFGYSSWKHINTHSAFLAILAAMTPPNLWRRIMNKDFNDARGYLSTIMQLKDTPIAHPIYLKAYFGIPLPEEVDFVGMGTLRVQPSQSIVTNDIWINNTMLQIAPRQEKYLKYRPQDAMPPNRPESNVDLTTKWGTLRARGGWPGFRKLDWWMSMLARELFDASSWRDIKNVQPFLDILGAATPPPIWESLKKEELNNAEDYFNLLKSKASKNLKFDPEKLKLNFGIPTPAEVDQVGFGTLVIHPGTEFHKAPFTVTPEVSCNPMLDTFGRIYNKLKQPAPGTGMEDLFVLQNSRNVIESTPQAYQKSLDSFFESTALIDSRGEGLRKEAPGLKPISRAHTPLSASSVEQSPQPAASKTQEPSKNSKNSAGKKNKKNSVDDGALTDPPRVGGKKAQTLTPSAKTMTETTTNAPADPRIETTTNARTDPRIEITTNAPVDPRTGGLNRPSGKVQSPRHTDDGTLLPKKPTSTPPGTQRMNESTVSAAQSEIEPTATVTPPNSSSSAVAVGQTAYYPVGKLPLVSRPRSKAQPGSSPALSEDTANTPTSTEQTQQGTVAPRSDQSIPEAQDKQAQDIAIQATQPKTQPAAPASPEEQASDVDEIDLELSSSDEEARRSSLPSTNPLVGRINTDKSSSQNSSDSEDLLPGRRTAADSVYPPPARPASMNSAQSHKSPRSKAKAPSKSRGLGGRIDKLPAVTAQANLPRIPIAHTVGAATNKLKTGNHPAHQRRVSGDTRDVHPLDRALDDYYTRHYPKQNDSYRQQSRRSISPPYKPRRPNNPGSSLGDRINGEYRADDYASGKRRHDNSEPQYPNKR